MEYLLSHGETLKSFNEQNPETRLVRDAEIESVAYSAGKTELATLGDGESNQQRIGRNQRLAQSQNRMLLQEQASGSQA